jgi:hypothetical protein
MAMVLFLIISLIKQFVRSFQQSAKFDFLYILLTYILGMAAAHMILEQGQRYAFPAIALIAIALGLVVQSRETAVNMNT